MTPRQIIREISKIRHSNSFLEELRSYEYRDGCEREDLRIINKNESQTNNEIMMNKCEDFGQNVAEKKTTVDRLNRNSMYQTGCKSVEVSCHGNKLLRNVETPTPTAFIESTKEPAKHLTNEEVPFAGTLYTTFKNISKRNGNRTYVQEPTTVFPKVKRECNSQQGMTSPSELCVENGWIVTGDTTVNNIRGRPKKLHAKPVIACDRETRPQGNNLTRKRWEDERGCVTHEVLVSKTQDRASCFVQDSKGDQRLRLHIYVPTADMND